MEYVCVPPGASLGGRDTDQVQTSTYRTDQENRIRLESLMQLRPGSHESAHEEVMTALDQIIAELDPIEPQAAKPMSSGWLDLAPITPPLLLNTAPRSPPCPPKNFLTQIPRGKARPPICRHGIVKAAPRSKAVPKKCAPLPSLPTGSLLPSAEPPADNDIPREYSQPSSAEKVAQSGWHEGCNPVSTSANSRETWVWRQSAWSNTKKKNSKTVVVHKKPNNDVLKFVKSWLKHHYHRSLLDQNNEIP